MKEEVVIDKIDQCTDEEKKETTKIGRMKTLSRMKDLLKWGAAEKGGKFIGRKVFHFRNRSASAGLKAITITEDDQFRWEMESFSISSPAASVMTDSSFKTGQCTPLHVRTGNWVTTDSEFVVLEL